MRSPACQLQNDDTNHAHASADANPQRDDRRPQRGVVGRQQIEKRFARERQSSTAHSGRREEQQFGCHRPQVVRRVDFQCLPVREDGAVPEIRRLGCEIIRTWRESFPAVRVLVAGSLHVVRGFPREESARFMRLQPSARAVDVTSVADFAFYRAQRSCAIVRFDVGEIVRSCQDTL
jgi:hypothetical protein